MTRSPTWKALLTLGLLVAPTLQQRGPAFARSNQDTLGIAHVGGDYRLTEEPFLIEGAKLIQNLNTKTVFVYLTRDYATRNYPNTDFGSPPPVTLAGLAAREPYQRLFNMNFSTYIITSLSFATDRGDGLSPEWTPSKPLEPERAERIKQEHYQLTKYLIQTYQGTGKSFILKNWEGDWALRGGSDKTKDLTEKQLLTARTWFNKRHEGVAQARQELSHLTGVSVVDAVEFNLLDLCREGRPCVLDDVAPHVDCDYLSYSAWETVIRPHMDAGQRRAKIFADIDYINSRPGSQGRPLIISEYGFPEELPIDLGEYTRTAAQAFIDAANQGKIEHAVFWQIIDNECEHNQPADPGHCRGFGLIRPDNSRTPAWYVLRNLLGVSNSAQFVSQNVPPTMVTGQSYNVSTTYRNTGNVAWNAANGYRLGSQNPQDSETWGLGRVYLDSTESITPGEEKVLEFQITAPSTPGNYNFQWRMLQEGVEWFGEPNTNLEIAITAQGDLNSDGTIDNQDLRILLANWGPVGPLPAADLNSDGGVNGLDFGQLRQLSDGQG